MIKLPWEIEVKPHVGWVDVFRGIAIVLVVLGHTGRGLDHRGLLHFEGTFTDRWVYSFHMPAFFFAAGLFAGQSLRRGRRAFVVDKFRSIAWPYLVWSVIYITSLRLFAGSSTTAFDPMMFARLPYEPVGNYWFLYVLFVIQVAYAIVAPLRLGSYLFWSGAVALWLAEPFKPFDAGGGSLWALHNVMKYAVYFALGDACSTHGLVQRAAGSLALAAVLFAVLTLLIDGGHSAAEQWWDLPLAICGIYGLIELSSWLDGQRGTSWLAILGRRSMEIYVAHNFATVALRILLLRLGVVDAALHLTLGTVAGVTLPLLLDRRSRFRAVRWLFTFGG